MRTIDEILDAEFETVTPEEWALLRQASDGASDEGSDRAAELEAKLTAACGDWAKLNQVIAEILND